MRSLSWLSMLFFITLSSTTRADWQYTKWGMTAQQVIAASKGAARPITSEERAAADAVNDQLRKEGHKLPPPKYATLAKGTHKIMDIDYEVSFDFYISDRRLARVTLVTSSTDDVSRLRILKALEQSYGAPLPSDVGAVTRVWKAKGDKVDFMPLINSVSYEKWPSGPVPGL